jgi:lysophospholipase L1-like esterase|tara:strand:- start:81 stop:737 length:657 start_codon:yes stop_codon:yes gene_type:complete
MKLKLAFFGDSICVGQGISIHEGWVVKISKELTRISSENKLNFFISNSSVNGRTTRQALESMPYEIQNQNYQILIIQFGMNDCNFWETDYGVPRVSKQAFKANLHEIIDRGINFGAKLIMINTNHPTPIKENFKNKDLSYQDSNRAYNEIIREVYNERNDVILNDIEMHIDSLIESKKLIIDDVVLNDRLHLSLKGHEIYFDFIFKKLENQINKKFKE